jgi:D-alanyl-D-alanine dipeptidase
MMKKSFSPQNRKRLQKRMMEALTSEIQTLNPEFQYLLADDLVTALQNRLIVFQRMQEKAVPLQK